MWRYISKQAYSRKFRNTHDSDFLAFAQSFGKTRESYRNPKLGLSQSSIVSRVNGKTRHLYGMSEVSCRNHYLGLSESSIISRVQGDFRVWNHMGCGSLGVLRSYGSAAEAIASTSEEDIDEIQGLIEEMNKENEALKANLQPKQPKTIGGMGIGKYNVLRRRQIKIETEAWEDAAKEYQELLMDMCEQKLAPNLPYIKSLFLGWFEPLRDAIAAEQKLCGEGKNRAAYAPYFDQLPADMMAVITMHKLMGLLMTGGGSGSARVVQAASHIGEAIEHEVCFYPSGIFETFCCFASFPYMFYRVQICASHANLCIWIRL